MIENTQNAKQKILQEFYSLYSINGYNKTTLTQLSKNCEMSLGHIGFYFKKKEQIVIAVINDLLSNFFMMLKEFFDVPDEPLPNMFFQLLSFSYACNQDDTLYMQMSEVVENIALLDEMIRLFHRLFQSVIRKLKYPVDELDIWTASNCSISSFYIMVWRSYHARLPLNYYRIFNLTCDILCTQIDVPEIRIFRQKSLECFENIDKDLLVQKFQETKLNLYKEK